ncbi:hypothetical protein PUR49_39715 [Streptomyces sp. BE147]|uniref:hypothetical protein n=1 Tax=Streptomyces sp. BE147 TaxID=3002524 RepID=UPI002E76E2EE|nr:hypothetical protein [Streptomyces sp. BE147]MEE1742612.1 hypothetical protein [Streptomyces sp. BE147]
MSRPTTGPGPTPATGADTVEETADPLMAKDLGPAAEAARAGGVHAEPGPRAAELYAAHGLSRLPTIGAHLPHLPHLPRTERFTGLAKITCR